MMPCRSLVVVMSGSNHDAVSKFGCGNVGEQP